MPTDLQTIVQRMVDAGESEANIAAVIQHYKTQYQPRNTLEEGRRSVAAGPKDDTPDDQAAWAERNKAPLANWFETKLRPLLEQVAHPRSISDIAQLVIPDQAGIGTALRYGGEVVRGARQGAAAVGSALRPAAARVMNAGAAVLDNPVAGMISPRAQQAGAAMGRAADALRVEPAAPPMRPPAPPGPPGVPPGPPPGPPPPGQPVPGPAPPPPAAQGAPSMAPPGGQYAASRAVFQAAGIEPLPAEVANVQVLISRGVPPEQALQNIVSKRPGGMPGTPSPAPAGAPPAQPMASLGNPTPVAPPAAPAVAKPAWTAEEVALGQRLMARGQTQQQAMDAILAQRQFKQIPGVQSSAEARAAVDARNASGQIKSPSAPTAAARRATPPAVGSTVRYRGQTYRVTGVKNGQPLLEPLDEVASVGQPVPQGPR